MIRIIDVKDSKAEELFFRGEERTAEEVEKAVRAILDDVKENGDEAVIKYTEKFDGVRLSALRVTEEEIDEAFAAADEFFIESLKKAAENIYIYYNTED